MKESFYFQHDYNARNDPKIQDVLIEYGVSGIGIFWCIVEQLYEQNGLLPLKTCKSIAFALHVENDVVESIVNNFGLFKNDGENFWSNSVNSRLSKRKDVTTKRKMAASKRWKSNTDMQMQSKCRANAMQNDAKEMKEKKKMDYIVVAHHADDVAETVLINLCRGTGIKGLTGIKSINGDILRPLLPCSRTDILKYIEDHQLGFRTDSTNNSLDYVRNKIRHQIIPVLKEINPSFLDTMTENCETLKETEEIFQYGIHRFQEEILDCEEDELLIHISKTLATPAPYTFLYETLKPFGFNKVQIRDILNTHTAIPGKQFIAGHHTLERGRIFWRLYDNSKCSRTIVSIPTTGIYTIGKLKVEFTLFPRTEEFVIPQQPDIACLDADKLQFPLLIRNWQAGDYFCPIGMKKSKKKLSDFFRDQKFSSKQKQECLLLLSDEKIAWIIGNRPDDRFKITSFTSNILQISIL